MSSFQKLLLIYSKKIKIGEKEKDKIDTSKMTDT